MSDVVVEFVALRLIFGSFVRMGAILFGGGYAMLPLLEQEIVTRRKWCTYEEMTDLYALSQVVPGVIAINAAMLIGHRYRGWRGALAAVLGMLCVPFLAILVLAMFFGSLMDHPWMLRLFAGFRPAVAGLLLATAWRMVARGGALRWQRLAVVTACGLSLLKILGPLGLILGAIATGGGWYVVAARSQRRRLE